ncbi:MAG TPA: PspA/IM30 family protein [Candidatus Latescibacteria bacterium]|jgi:phage shock protein A|nr:phage shock protein A [Gemmatimonadaceae bacterium]MDP6017045.1 PspA/IM30 family protein [Candidatus Latescibacterota bacterium]HJP32868.1 PspA/IM30 family protein [Candidatus Latescibacterota bacterium]
MAGIFNRLFKAGEAEAHSLVDKLEDPIKMSEQAVRDLRKDLQESLKSLAEVKSLAIRMSKDADDAKRLAGDYERKAMLLLQKGQSGDVEAGEAERLAMEALSRKEEAAARALQTTQQAQTQNQMVANLQNNVNDLKSKVASYENDLVMLKARARTANATRKINQRLSNVDTKGTVALLERMKDKVSEEEALSQAYGEMADSGSSIDDEIDKALLSGGPSKAEDSLAQLKSKMGIS